MSLTLRDESRRMTQIVMHPTTAVAAQTSAVARVLRAARAVLITVPLLVAWLAVAALHDLAASMSLLRR